MGREKSRGRGGTDFDRRKLFCLSEKKRKKEGGRRGKGRGGEGAESIAGYHSHPFRKRKRGRGKETKRDTCAFDDAILYS